MSVEKIQEAVWKCKLLAGSFCFPSCTSAVMNEEKMQQSVS